MRGAPALFCKDRTPEFVWAPVAKRMHKIMRIDFENYIFATLLKGHIPLRHPLFPKVPHFLLVLNLGALFYNNLGFTPAIEAQAMASGKKNQGR